MLTVENESLFDELQSVWEGWRVIFVCAICFHICYSQFIFLLNNLFSYLIFSSHISFSQFVFIFLLISSKVLHLGDGCVRLGEDGQTVPGGAG